MNKNKMIKLESWMSKVKEKRKRLLTFIGMRKKIKLKKQGLSGMYKELQEWQKRGKWQLSCFEKMLELL